MQIHLEQKPVESLEWDGVMGLAVGGQANGRFKDSLGDVYSSGEVAGKIFEMTLVHHTQGLKAKRLLLAGAGPAGKFTTAELRRVSGAALRHLKSRSIRNIAIMLEGSFGGPEHVEAAVEGAMLGDYEPDRYKSEKKDVKVIDHFTVSARGGGDELNRAAEMGRTIAEAQKFSRELSTEPAHKPTPTSPAESFPPNGAAHGPEGRGADTERIA